MSDRRDRVPGFTTSTVGEQPGQRPIGGSHSQNETESDTDGSGSTGQSVGGGQADADTADGVAGQVYLVGAGPGDPDLLTRRAWKVLRRADSILHDSLTPRKLLDDLPDSATVVDVGKRPPEPVTQNEIHDRLRARAVDGETVVRLKGGDPNVFGRGGEEAEYLASERIPFEVVPGVSSVLAASGLAGIPLTHRDHASSVTVVTGHETPDKAESALDWGALADTIRAGGTLVVLMGVSRLANYVDHLRTEGLPGDTPVALVQQVTWDSEQTVRSTLADVVADVRNAGVQPPAVTIVGDVVTVRELVESAHVRD